LRYNVAVNRLTKQEQWVLFVVLILLLTGWAVKAYRTHISVAAQNDNASATTMAQSAKP
jgi:hypothetical protein